MKRIAVTCEMEYMGKPQMTRAMCNMDYVNFVVAAGASPFIVCPEMDVEAIADSMDGLLLSGGKDINPLLYGEDLDYQGATNCNIVRDVFEKQLYYAFLRRAKPIFGICRGFQLIGIFNGFTLLQEINKYKDVTIAHSQGGKEITGDNPVHKMTNRGILRQLMGKVIPINSFHHQGFMMKGKTRKGDWIREDDSVLGWSRSNEEAKMLEAIMLTLPSHEDGPNNTLVGGVQYHPERMLRSGIRIEEHLAPFQYVMGLLDDDWYDIDLEEDEQQLEMEETGKQS